MVTKQLDIIAAFHEVREDIAKLDNELAERWNEIGETAFNEGRDLTEEEEEEQTDIDNGQKAINGKLKDLAVGFLDDLENASDVSELNNKIVQINKQLVEDLEGLKRLERSAKLVAKIFDGIAKISKKAAALIL